MRWGRRVVALLWVAVFAGGAVACSSEGSSDEAETSLEGEEAEEAEQEEGEARMSCSREELRLLAEGFLNALAAEDDPSQLSFSPDLKYTENGGQIEPGEGFWQTAGPARFQRHALDTDTCGTHTQAVVEEDGADVIVGVRLQLEGDDVIEVEVHITRESDYFFYDPDALAASDEEVPAEIGWEELVPEERRATREEMVVLADGYFESFGGEALVPMDNECYRAENGQLSATGDCGAMLEMLSPEVVTERRYPVVDVEAGVVVAYVLFGDALDSHMFKVVDGEVRLIDVVITGGGHESSGWE